MNDKNDNKTLGENASKSTLTLSTKTLHAKNPLDKERVQQQMGQRSKTKTIEVEVKRKRFDSNKTPYTKDKRNDTNPSKGRVKDSSIDLTANELDVRIQVLKESMIRQKEEERLKLILQKSLSDAALVASQESSVVSEAVSSDSVFTDINTTVQQQNVEITVSDLVVQSKQPESRFPKDEVKKVVIEDGLKYEKKYREKPVFEKNAPIILSSYPKKEITQDFSKGPKTYSDSAPFPHKKRIDAPRPPFKDGIKPIILRSSTYGPKTGTTPIGSADSIVIDAVLDKNRGEHRTGIKTKKKTIDDDQQSVEFKVDNKKGVVKEKVSADAPRKLHRNVLKRVLDDEDEVRSRSLAAVRRARQKHQKKSTQNQLDSAKIQREVIIPETITVGDLANRMAVRGGEVVKSLMKLGVMATINQILDADTAELICQEFGHHAKRVADSDIEIGLGEYQDQDVDMISRAPVVTVMGHVDHGKTSLLDALRKTDVVSGEVGGITQHIGAYQVTMSSGKKITFIDTPGHAAFSEMRARGVNVTDIVIIVVAADDGIMLQTIEAISHAKAGNVPIIVAINKMDKPGADAQRVRSELLNHGIVAEEFGGDVMCVEVSAKQNINLDKLEEMILLQAEILELTANSNRTAVGAVVEAEIDKGRGPVATILVQKGTLKIGDVFLAGAEWGRVKAMVNDHGKNITVAYPSEPVVILGFNDVPCAGDEFFVVENEQKAREIAEYRKHKIREKLTILKTKGSMENIMIKIVAGDIKELPMVIKADVQGSLEAIMTSLSKMKNDEVSTRVLHGAVGAISESDVILAKASGGVIIGFNIRATPQARDFAKREGIEIRYYGVIYDMLNEVKALLGGLLSPDLSEKYLGSAEVRNVFIISKVDGKVAGSYVLDGIVKRGAKIRLLRDNVVIYEGELSSLRRFKDEVKEAKESYECGIVLDKYDDIKVGDIIECFEIEKTARKLVI